MHKLIDVVSETLKFIKKTATFFQDESKWEENENQLIGLFVRDSHINIQYITVLP